jgi:hypothetical protein
MVGLNTNETARDDVACAAVRRCLDEHAAMTLDELVARSGMPVLTLARTLRRMGAGGQIEVLRPLSGPRNGWKRGERRRRVFYRLVQDCDSDYTWQQWVTAPVPLSRFCNWSREEDTVRLGSVVASDPEDMVLTLS